MCSISIIIPSYNAEKYLVSTLNSVIAQAYADWECIIVDDGSTDQTGMIADEYVARDSRFKVIHQKNGGLPAARNAGIAASNPEYPYITFLDADDLWESDALTLLATALNKYPEAVGAHALARFINSESKFIGIGELEKRIIERRKVECGRAMICPIDDPTTFSILSFGNLIYIGAVLIRRKYLLTAGRFDESLRSCEDYNLWLRMSRYGDFVFLNQPVLRYRQHGLNMSGNYRRMDRYNILARAYVLSLPDLSKQERCLLQTGYRLSQRLELGDRLRNAKVLCCKGMLLHASHELRRALRCYIRSLRGLPMVSQPNDDLLIIEK